MTYKEIAIKILEDSDIPLSTKEIWQKACEKEYDKELEETFRKENPDFKISQTPDASLGAKIYIDIKYNTNNSTFIKVGRGKFFLREKEHILNNSIENNIEEEIEEKEKTEISINTNIKNIKVKEEDLHIPLSKYLHTMKIYSKTINANSTTTQQKGKMKWGTPDIVGVTFRENINENILELFNNINLPTVEIYAYELKLQITLSNLIEYYFQAVSNSSWANEAWLVAMEIDVNDAELIEEIKRLNQSFGVGVIYLNYTSPEDSEIIISAKKRNYLDIDTMNKLTQNNQFNDFIKNVNKVINPDHKSKNDIVSNFINTNIFNNIN